MTAIDAATTNGMRHERGCQQRKVERDLRRAVIANPTAAIKPRP